MSLSNIHVRFIYLNLMYKELSWAVMASTPQRITNMHRWLVGFRRRFRLFRLSCHHNTKRPSKIDRLFFTFTNKGFVTKVNNLFLVQPIKTRYIGDGDVVVGRITAVETSRWRVDLNSTLDAVLPLTSVNLPGGELVSRSNLVSLFK